MSNRIDQLFKDKLSEHNLPPSAEAWAKIQAGTTSGNKKIVYWRIAASLLLFGLLLSSWLVFYSPVEVQTQQIAKADKTNTDAFADAKKQVDVIEQIKQQSAPLSNTEIKDKEPIKTVKSTQTKSNQLEEKKGDLQPTLQVEENLNSNEMKITNQTNISVADAAAEKPIVIEFTLPSLDEKHTDEIAIVNEGETKSTGIKKLLETAIEVKNGDAEFGTSLRDIKNELFALDFKKDKTRTN